jgi:hypothetical protein
MPTLRLFLKASPDSPLHSVDLSSVAQFLLYLTDEDHLRAKKETPANGDDDVRTALSCCRTLLPLVTQLVWGCVYVGLFGLGWRGQELPPRGDG